MSYNWTNVTTRFTLSDGRVLKCEYCYRVLPATRHCEEERDDGEPQYFIDDEEVSFEQLPKGLDAIAECMYRCAHWQFDYTESKPEMEF